MTMAVGALLGMIGSLLPWLTLDGFGLDEPDGFETYAFFGDDVDPIVWTNPGAYVVGASAVVLVLAVVILVVGRAVWSAILGVISTLVAGGIALAALLAIVDTATLFEGVDIGPGIVLVAFAALVAFTGAVLVAVTR
jgi:hypothetical protein